MAPVISGDGTDEREIERHRERERGHMGQMSQQLTFYAVIWVVVRILILKTKILDSNFACTFLNVVKTSKIYND